MEIAFSFKLLGAEKNMDKLSFFLKLLNKKLKILKKDLPLKLAGILKYSAVNACQKLNDNRRLLL